MIAGNIFLLQEKLTYQNLIPFVEVDLDLDLDLGLGLGLGLDAHLGLAGIEWSTMPA